LLDLKDYSLPIFEEAVSPAYVQGAYENPEANRWAQKIAEADGFIVVTPEYNHGYPSSLKNNIDYLYKEWGNKPICFVSYGSAGGARVIQQLRQVAIELQMAPIRNSVHIMSPWSLTEPDGTLKSGALDSYIKSAQNMFGQLTWWATALKNARDGK
jgi:NAD(P)H-dependent FMN reductase